MNQDWRGILTWRNRNSTNHRGAETPKRQNKQPSEGPSLPAPPVLDRSIFSAHGLVFCVPLSLCGSNMPDLSVTLGHLHLANPILVASGTFGYAREMAGGVDFALLVGVIPTTVTRQPRIGNAPPRTVKTPSGMLN